AWGQFMSAEFGVGDWLIVASQAESHQLSRIPELQKLFIPVVVLTLLGVTLLSLRQIRSILVPVEQLAGGARRIAHNDFSTPVSVKRDDEFGELAGAFNTMSQRLEHQIAVLTTLSEIDRLILSMLDTEQIVRIVMERVAQVLPVDCVGITLLDHDNPDLARTYSYAPHDPTGASMSRQQLPASDRAALGTAPDTRWVPLDGAAQSYLAPLCERGMTTAYVQPIVWRGVVCGVLALGSRGAPAIENDELKQIRDFADRVAVAMSSAWRDEQLYMQAHYDPLTGLPNRLLLKDRLDIEIANCRREGNSLALLFIDLDHFKNVNDSLGHSQGDRVLKLAADRIAHCVRGSDTVSRLGGDEFTVLLSRLNQPQDAAAVAEQILRSLSEEFVVDRQSSFLSASIGIAVCPQDGSTAETLLRNADTAMYRAKAGGRGQVAFFEEGMNASAVERSALDREMRRAIERGEFELHYQPQIDLVTGTVLGAEALLRWTHPTLGNVPPARFIPIAEEFGHVEQIGAWALRAACRQLSAWQIEGLTLGRLAVNVSGRQFRNEALVALVTQCAGDAGITLDMLELEITEGVLVDPRGNAERMLRELAAMGVAISLDDFGTGFSSMAYLKRFPVHKIKIDRAFVKGLGHDRDSGPIVTSIIAMAHALGMSVIAEGVETAEQLAILRELHCDQAQGFHFSQPLPAAEFAAYVSRRANSG
ncbi:MAG: EAL domain-containing protein, partial [Betaproteobacteria bacterium]|nr:EAL domain-containing protein [Betaproteobacteria bacterium]